MQFSKVMVLRKSNTFTQLKKFNFFFFWFFFNHHVGMFRFTWDEFSRENILSKINCFTGGKIVTLIIFENNSIKIWWLNVSLLKNFKFLVNRKIKKFNKKNSRCVVLYGYIWFGVYSSKKKKNTSKRKNIN